MKKRRSTLMSDMASYNRLSDIPDVLESEVMTIYEDPNDPVLVTLRAQQVSHTSNMLSKNSGKSGNSF